MCIKSALSSGMNHDSIKYVSYDVSLMFKLICPVIRWCHMYVQLDIFLDYFHTVHVCFPTAQALMNT